MLPIKERPAYYSMLYSQVSDGSDRSESPGPSDYYLPTTMGPNSPYKHSSGAFSMTDRHEIMTKELSPGPAKYDATDPNIYKNRGPSYSMTMRHPDLCDETHVPASNEYSPKYYTKGGGFSFGLRTNCSPYMTAADEMPYH